MWLQRFLQLLWGGWSGRRPFLVTFWAPELCCHDCQAARAVSLPVLSRGPPRSPASGLQPAGSSAEHAWNTLWKLLAKLCSGAPGPPRPPFAEIVLRMSGGPSQDSHGERISLGSRRNGPHQELPWYV